MEKEHAHNSVCSCDKDESNCVHSPCEWCGWSYGEIQRRRELPLVRLPNGLLGKQVGRGRPGPILSPDDEDEPSQA